MILIFTVLGIILVTVGLLVWYYLKPKEEDEEEEEVSYASVDNFDVSTVTQDDINDELRMYQQITAAPPLTEEDTGDPILNMLKDEQLYQDLAIGASPEIVRQIIETYIDFKNVGRGYPAETATARILKSMKESTNPSILGRMGAIGDSKAVKKAATKSGIQIAEEAGERAAVRAGVRIVMATPLKFLFSAYEAVDFIGLVLDQFLGAYSDTTLDENYMVQMRDYAIEVLRYDIETNKGLKWPQIVGPLDKLDEGERQRKYQDVLIKLINNDQNFERMYFQESNRIAVTGTTREERLTLLEDFQRYQLKPYIYEEWAKEVNGKVVIDADGEIDMSFSTKEQCDTSYDWPLKPNQVFAMWSDDNGGYSYIGPGRILMDMCSSWGEIGDDVTINKSNYTCCVSSTVCRQNATEPAGGCYCKIEESQYILELLFGKTIVRGLKQLFDPKMYEDCPTGSIDDGLTCRNEEAVIYPRPQKIANCELAGNGWKTTISGPGGMCGKCPDRFPYHPGDGVTCYLNESDSKAGNLGLAIIKQPQCPPNGHPEYTKRTSGIDPLCYHEDVDIGLLVKFPTGRQCQEGYKQCTPGSGLCYKNPPCCVRGGAHSNPRLGCHAPGNVKIPKPQCPSGYYETAGMCYAKSHKAKYECPSGYEPNNENLLCVKSVPIKPGDNRSLIQMDADTCPDGFKDKRGGVCYGECRATYRVDSTGINCETTRPRGVFGKKRKVPFARPDIKNSPFGKMMNDIQECTNDACRAKIGVFMGLSVLPIMYNTGMIDILNITYDLQAAYTQKEE